MVLCKLYDFKAGVLYLYERNRMYAKSRTTGPWARRQHKLMAWWCGCNGARFTEIVQYYMDNNEYANILAACKKYRYGGGWESRPRPRPQTIPSDTAARPLGDSAQRQQCAQRQGPGPVGACALVLCRAPRRLPEGDRRGLAQYGPCPGPHACPPRHRRRSRCARACHRRSTQMWTSTTCCRPCK